MRRFAPSSRASTIDERSLSTTASTVLSAPPGCCTAGTEPPPHAIVTTPASRSVRTLSVSTMPDGFGLGTTRRPPRPLSSFIFQPSSASCFFAPASS